MARGYAIIAKGDQPKALDEETFLVPPQSGKGRYRVSRNAGLWHCECPDHMFREVECKYIHAAKFWIAVREKIKANEIINLNEPEATECKFCKAPNIIKYGKRACKQVYRCKNCNHKFVMDQGFKKMKNDPRIISLTLDLYSKGVSLRKITGHL